MDIFQSFWAIHQNWPKISYFLLMYPIPENMCCFRQDNYNTTNMYQVILLTIKLMLPTLQVKTRQLKMSLISIFLICFLDSSNASIIANFVFEELENNVIGRLNYVFHFYVYNCIICMPHDR